MKDADFNKATEIANGKFAELHTHIGSICAGFADVEMELINAIGLLVDDGDLDVGEIVADRLSYSQTVDLFERLAKHRLRKDTPRELPRLVADLRKAAALRNDVIHSSWSCSLDEKPTLYQERVRRKHTRHQQSAMTIPLAQFPKIGKFIHDLFMALQDFETEYL